MTDLEEAFRAHGVGQRVNILLEQGASFDTVPSCLPVLLEWASKHYGVDQKVNLLLDQIKYMFMERQIALEM